MACPYRGGYRKPSQMGEARYEKPIEDARRNPCWPTFSPQPPAAAPLGPILCPQGRHLLVSHWQWPLLPPNRFHRPPFGRNGARGSAITRRKVCPPPKCPTVLAAAWKVPGPPHPPWPLPDKPPIHPSIPPFPGPDPLERVISSSGLFPSLPSPYTTTVTT